MITQITTLTETEVQTLKQNWRGRKLLSYYFAYGGSYEFCRLFRLQEDGQSAVMLLFNATLLLCGETPVAAEEAAMFIEMHLQA